MIWLLLALAGAGGLFVWLGVADSHAARRAPRTATDPCAASRARSSAARTGRHSQPGGTP